MFHGVSAAMRTFMQEQPRQALQPTPQQLQQPPTGAYPYDPWEDELDQPTQALQGHHAAVIGQPGQALPYHHKDHKDFIMYNKLNTPTKNNLDKLQDYIALLNGRHHRACRQRRGRGNFSLPAWILGESSPDVMLLLDTYFHQSNGVLMPWGSQVAGIPTRRPHLHQARPPHVQEMKKPRTAQLKTPKWPNNQSKNNDRGTNPKRMRTSRTPKMTWSGTVIRQMAKTMTMSRNKPPHRRGGKPPSAPLDMVLKGWRTKPRNLKLRKDGGSSTGARNRPG